MTQSKENPEQFKRLGELCKESPALHKKIVDLVLAGPVCEPGYMPIGFAIIEHQKEQEK